MENGPANFEAMAHTYSIALFFAHSKVRLVYTISRENKTMICSLLLISCLIIGGVAYIILSMDYLESNFTPILVRTFGSYRISELAPFWISLMLCLDEVI